MFPGYLFVAINSNQQNWRPIRSTAGVRTLVSCGERLSLLSDAFVAGLKAREIGGAILRPENPYYIGQQIQIAGGPFDGLIGTIVEMDQKERLTVLMNLLSGQVKVSLENHWSTAV
jgi:transcriptional antiterminator RfaH